MASSTSVAIAQGERGRQQEEPARMPQGLPVARGGSGRAGYLRKLRSTVFSTGMGAFM